MHSESKQENEAMRDVWDSSEELGQSSRFL